MTRDRSFSPVPQHVPPKHMPSEAQVENVNRALGTIIACATEMQQHMRFRSVEASSVRLRHLLDSVAYAQEQLK